MYFFFYSIYIYYLLVHQSQSTRWRGSDHHVLVSFFFPLCFPFSCVPTNFCMWQFNSSYRTYCLLLCMHALIHSFLVEWGGVGVCLSVCLYGNHSNWVKQSWFLGSRLRISYSFFICVLLCLLLLLLLLLCSSKIRLKSTNQSMPGCLIYRSFNF